MAFAKRLACFVISSCSSREYVAKRSYFVPMSTGIAVWEMVSGVLSTSQGLVSMGSQQWRHYSVPESTGVANS